jgi:hypothetical protein
MVKKTKTKKKVKRPPRIFKTKSGKRYIKIGKKKIRVKSKISDKKLLNVVIKNINTVRDCCTLTQKRRTRRRQRRTKKGDFSKLPNNGMTSTGSTPGRTLVVSKSSRPDVDDKDEHKLFRLIQNQLQAIQAPQRQAQQAIQGPQRQSILRPQRQAIQGPQRQAIQGPQLPAIQAPQRQAIQAPQRQAIQGQQRPAIQQRQQAPRAIQGQQRPTIQQQQQAPRASTKTTNIRTIEHLKKFREEIKKYPSDKQIKFSFRNQNFTTNKKSALKSLKEIENILDTSENLEVVKDIARNSIQIQSDALKENIKRIEKYLVDNSDPNDYFVKKSLWKDKDKPKGTWLGKSDLKSIEKKLQKYKTRSKSKEIIQFEIDGYYYLGEAGKVNDFLDEIKEIKELNRLVQEANRQIDDMEIVSSRSDPSTRSSSSSPFFPVEPSRRSSDNETKALLENDRLNE